MTTVDLKTLFEKEYNRTEWIIALQEIFHIKDLHITPRKVDLGENPFGASAVELGHFETSEGLKIGLYEVSISTNKLVGKNKVSLRNLMRKVYQEDGDAALIVFAQDHTWRFTYASELTVTNPETGLRERKQTDPKRYTYIFGRNQLCRTAAERFAEIKSSTDLFDTHISISEIEKAFSVDVLTKDFYRELSNWYFWALTKVKFPANTAITDEVNNATSLIRLITRLIFVWFMKQKGLIPDELFDKEEVGQLINPTDSTGSTYYKAILQNLFFATLNTPIKEGNRSFVRRQTGNQDFYRYQRFFKNKERFLELTRDIPFLNGGLFDNLDKRIAKGDPEDLFIDCFSNHQENESLLSLPDFLFFGGAKDVDLSESYDDVRKKHQDIRGIIDILHSYNFTVEENTPLEIQVALDPEMLGKVFENLLASYNPETKSTARKQTGSFYTPREIVNYMVDESLIAYLNQKLNDESEASSNEENPEIDLRTLVSYSNDANPFNETQTQTLVNAIGSIKVLDPACGSGAFPMGVLQQLVHVLTKLDPENLLWRDYQINKAQDEIKEALRENDKEVRHLRLKEIEDAFSLNEEDYGRKLFLIENCIYGIDIQPIAVQISKLRFFISLICEQNKQPDNSENFGIKSLPNLETKFVAANTLIGLEIDPQIEIRTDDILKLEKELVRIRKNHFVERDKPRKKLLRDRDRQTRDKILQCLHTEYDNNTKVLLSKIESEKFNLASYEKGHQSEKIPGRRKNLEDGIVKIKKEINRLNEKVTKNHYYEQNLMNRAAWDPYNTNESSGFYDSEWMFGINDGFDVVIGNPPYVSALELKKLIPKDEYIYLKANL
jgi:adenine-specific DNA-methyltransferase